MEQTHGCRGHFREAVPVVERSGGGEVVWAGIVHAFDLEGHPAASRCYALNLFGSHSPPLAANTRNGHQNTPLLGAGIVYPKSSSRFGIFLH